MDIALSISKARPGALWSLNGNSYEGIVWLDQAQTKPTANELDVAWSQILSDREANAIDEASRDEKKLNVKNAVPTLRRWATDAETAVSAWDGQTTAQRFAALKVVVTRFGVLSDRLADLIQALRIDK